MLTPMRFVRFCRSLALVSTPWVAPIVAVSVPAFVAGCESNVGCNGVTVENGAACGNAAPPDAEYSGPDTIASDTRDASPPFDAAFDVTQDTSTGVDDGDAEAGGPGWPPEMPVLA